MTEGCNIVQNINEKQEYSNIVPIWKFVLLSILSFNFYKFYWVYENWKDIKQNFVQYNDINPVLRTLGAFFVPILGLYIHYMQFKIIQTERIKRDTNYFKINIIFVVVIYFCMGLAGKFKNPYNLLVALNFIPFIFIQKELNILWRNMEKIQKQISALSLAEFIIVIFGIFVWIFEICYHLKLIK